MKKNISFIIPGLKSGGAERVLSTLSLNLSDKYKQYIFTWNSKEIDYEFNSEIVEIETENSKSLIKNIYILFKRVVEVKKYKKKFKIDCAISHLEGANIVNLLSKDNERTIITVHNFQSKERKGIYGFIFKVLIKLLYNRADKIIAVSQLISDDLVKNFKVDKSKICVIYNPYDITKIKEMMQEDIEEEYEELFNNEVIINVGRLTKQKGQWHLIKSFSELIKSRKNIKLIILGKGELEKEIKKLISDLNLENDVILLGYHNNPFKFISRANIFALTSLYEGFPMCIAEAMACNTPVVSVDCKSGPREMLSENKNIFKTAEEIEWCDYGVLTPNFNDNCDISNLNITKEEKIFAEALNNILKNNYYIEKYSRVGENRVSDFEVNKIIRKWESII